MSKGLQNLITFAILLVIGFLIGLSCNRSSDKNVKIDTTLVYTDTVDTILYSYINRDTTIYDFKYSIDTLDSIIYNIDTLTDPELYAFLTKKNTQDTIKLDSVSMYYNLSYFGKLEDLRLGYFYNRQIKQRTITNEKMITKFKKEFISLSLGVGYQWYTNSTLDVDGVNINGIFTIKDWQFGYQNNITQTLNGNMNHEINISKKLFKK